MNFRPRRGLGILLMAVSLVFVIATACTLFFYIAERDHSEGPPAEGDHSSTTKNEWAEEKSQFSPDPSGRPWSSEPISPFV